jgi:hypothetical protein
MTFVQLKVAPERPPNQASTALVHERIQHLRAEIRGLALEHVSDLEDALLTAQRIADEIAGGGDPYPPGVREIAARLSEDIAAKSQTLSLIMERSRTVVRRPPK